MPTIFEDLHTVLEDNQTDCEIFEMHHQRSRTRSITQFSDQHFSHEHDIRELFASSKNLGYRTISEHLF